MNLIARWIDWWSKAVAPTAAALSPINGGRGWYPIVREPYTGAWQQNQELVVSDVLAYGPVFACVTLIAQTIAKLALRLMEQDARTGIWSETSNPAFSPVLRKPNRYQTRIKFLEQWITSKLIWGNAYILLERDNRGVVVALYVLNPQRCRPLVAPDGAVYYRIDADPLVELATDTIVPASEIMHDPMVCLYHPLCGVSPIYACGMAAMQGLAMQKSSTALFANGGQPPGVITVPGAPTEEQIRDAQAMWKDRGPGVVAILTNGMQYEPLAINPVDAELIKQLEWTGADVARCFHVPAFMIEIGTTPPYGNYGPLVQMFYADALQPLMANLKATYEAGIGLLTPINGTQYGVEFDVNDLLLMDHETRAKVASEAVKGVLSVNEVRHDYFDKAPVPGGESVYMQEQNWPVKLLEARELPTRTPTPPAAPTPMPVTKDLAPAELAAEAIALFRRSWAA